MSERSGSAGYIAPEVNKQKNIIVGPEIDIWAFGIILYELCVGYKPQQVPKNQKYGHDHLRFNDRDWRKLEENGRMVRDLIKHCLQIHPEKRISAQEALQHPWFQC
uniref:Protein kinase domain-containing protein n=1 Tax=Strombidium rassoulzadegani TaxID=1082188 RepID=A0A7S3CPV5_9SPIT|mmetsp:Transcript_3145/g.5259  ORF Transcript_3145/g.5259 Transcript_3145/m.5259 type:complete len:106 (+) Transcript_3145:314-631(+)